MTTVTFYRMYPDTLPPLRADRSANGTMPASAFQYCEAMRTASSHGWYVFPPFDVRLRWTGAEVLFDAGDGWVQLEEIRLPDFDAHWNDHAPSDMRDLAPAFLTAIPVRGIVQVWSGLLASTAPGWNLLVRPLVNIPHSHLYSVYEGVVETDRFRPAPLFTNLQLTSTEVPITLRSTQPLFQVQPMPRDTYAEVAHRTADLVELGRADAPALSRADWDGYRATIRTDRPDDPHVVGRYASATRRRTKQQGEA